MSVPPYNQAMSQAAIAPPKISANDRLGMTLFFAIAFHGILILGISFIAFPPDAPKTAPSLDVILVNTASNETPDKADYLAQVSQDGGGDSDKKTRPTDMFSAPTLSPTPGIAMQQSVTAQPRNKQIDQQRLLTQQQSDFSISTQKKISKLEQQNQPVEKQQLNKLPARMVEELSLIYQQHAQKPKEKFINSRTKEYVAARYMRNWIDKIERLGNADYPDQAIRNKLSGTLILDVVINSDGSLRSIDLRRSSGHKILDDAARRIVRMAAPFAHFPKKLKQQADVLHITRSWEFMSSNQLKSH